MIRMSRVLTIAGLSAVSLASLAVAQEPVSALKGHNADAPIDISSQRIEVQDRANRAVFAGDVIARPGELILSTARLTVAYSNSGGLEINRLDASGGVTVKSPSETARGDFGIYDLNRRLIMARVSGFGQDGPLAAKPCFDVIGQAMGGPDGLLTIHITCYHDAIEIFHDIKTMDAFQQGCCDIVGESTFSPAHQAKLKDLGVVSITEVFNCEVDKMPSSFCNKLVL